MGGGATCYHSVTPAVAGSVHLIYSVDQKLGRKGGTRTDPQQPLKEAHSGQHHTTHFLRGWSKSTPTQSTIFHTLTSSLPARLPAIPPGSSTGLEDLCQANGGAWQKVKVMPREGAPTPTHASSTGPVSNAQLLKAKLQSQHQLAHTCTAHRRLGTPSHQIRVNWLF